MGEKRLCKSLSEISIFGRAPLRPRAYGSGIDHVRLTPSPTFIFAPGSRAPLLGKIVLEVTSLGVKVIGGREKDFGHVAVFTTQADLVDLAQ